MAVLEIHDTRRTSADVVFETLQHEIMSLDLLPGAKMSEVDIARRFGISRQPVRDAFARLGNLGLLLIRPQKATVVRHFSMREIKAARFVRIAVEREVAHTACRSWDRSLDAALDDNLDRQAKAVGDSTAFHDLDYAFHRTICDAAGIPFAFETIAACKSKVDRLCMLDLAEEKNIGVLIRDHRDLLAAIRAQDVATAEALVRTHLSRLEPTIDRLRERHGAYFAD